MNLLRLSSLFLAPAILASVALACGEITDPTQTSERTATISGALTASNVPAGARVAIVWRNGSGQAVVVGAEAEIVSGKFTMSLAAPPDTYFFPFENESYDSLNAGSTAPNVDAPSPSPAPSGGTSGSSGTDPGGPGSSSGGSKVIAKLGTRTNVSGGINEPLGVAAAGFVVYVDANGNGKLDLEGDYASSPDTLLGGNKELILTYLKGGGQLDYEKLRDKSGVLPVAGYNLAWTEGRWLPLSLVELQLTNKPKLPSAVCSSYGSSGSSGRRPSVAVVEEEPATLPPSGGSSGSSGTIPEEPYPAPGSEGLHCYDNGYSWYYTGNCPKPPPPPVGLCASDYGAPTIACSGKSHTHIGENPPTGWPCPITGPNPNGSGSTGSSGSTSGGSMPTPSGDGGSIPAPDAGGS